MQTTSQSLRHTATYRQQKYTYNQSVSTQHQYLILNYDKTTSALSTPDPAEYNTSLHLQINYTTLDMHTHLKIMGHTIDPNLTYNKQHSKL